MKQGTVRVVCWIMAGLMLFGVIAAIIGLLA
jgi:hypothetical protein